MFQNGTWYHLDVHSKPHFLQKPDDILYVSIGDSIILTCQVIGLTFVQMGAKNTIHWVNKLIAKGSVTTYMIKNMKEKMWIIYESISIFIQLW